MRLVIGHLYPDLMNLYADRGNIIALTRRAGWRGIKVEVVPLNPGDRVDSEAVDILFIGGGQDKEQRMAAEDLVGVKGDDIRAAVEAGAVVLAICGGYQLFGRYYRPAEGEDLPGLGVFDAVTVHKGTRVPRCIGNVVVEWEGRTLVGFENHGGRTYLGPRCQPLGRVVVGYGNNSEDGLEGAVCHNAYGTYLHGSLLPKNHHFADHLLRLALTRRYGAVDLAPLDDQLESLAHAAAVRRARETR